MNSSFDFISSNIIVLFFCFYDTIYFFSNAVICFGFFNPIMRIPLETIHWKLSAVAGFVISQVSVDLERYKLWKKHKESEKGLEHDEMVI